MADTKHRLKKETLERHRKNIIRAAEIELHEAIVKIRERRLMKLRRTLKT